MKHLRNEKGMATIETIPLIMIFVVLLCYEFGVFGVIHTGIMQSMSARAYAFETFRNRSNLTYFRDTPTPLNNFHKTGVRTHGIASEAKSEADGSADGIAAERPLRVGMPLDPDLQSRNDRTRHNETIFDQNVIRGQKQNERVDISPVWIQVQYGMCLNARCGG